MQKGLQALLAGLSGSSLPEKWALTGGAKVGVYGGG